MVPVIAITDAEPLHCLVIKIVEGNLPYELAVEIKIFLYKHHVKLILLIELKQGCTRIRFVLCLHLVEKGAERVHHLDLFGPVLSRRRLINSKLLGLRCLLLILQIIDCHRHLLHLLSTLQLTCLLESLFGALR